jgi:hypothetical protein
MYDDDADSLLLSDIFPDRVSLLPGSSGQRAGECIRIMWGQDLLRDMVDGRYRAVVCGVNDQDNSHGIISQLVDMMQTSQWTPRSVTSYARMFHDSAAVHAASDREPYVLKFDLDSLLIMAILRPRNKDHFTVDDIYRGFRTVSKMVGDRRDRLPIAAVSFLNARANRLIGPDGREPSFESVLRTMFNAGFRGDVYTAPPMWKHGSTGVFPTYPFPEGVERMRNGSS